MQCKYSFKKIRFVFGPVPHSRLSSNPAAVLPASTPKAERQLFARRRTKLTQPQTHASNHQHKASQQHRPHHSRDATPFPSSPPIESLSHEYIVRNLTKAFEHRKKLEAEGILESDPNSAFRAVNHKHDGLPGLVIDIYGSYALIILNSRHWDYHVKTLQRFLLSNEIFPVEAVYLASHIRKTKSDQQQPHGALFYANKQFDATPESQQTAENENNATSNMSSNSNGAVSLISKPPKGLCIGGVRPENHRTIVTEHGLDYVIQLDNGAASGLYLDQRDNREKLEQLLLNVETQRYLKLKNKKIVNPNAKHKQDAEIKKTFLNCFSFTCSFGMIAAKCDWSSLNIDISATSLEIGRSNYKLNKLSLDGHVFWEKEVFRGLYSLNSQDMLYDVVLIDPPTSSKVRRQGKIGPPEEVLTEEQQKIMNAQDKAFKEKYKKAIGKPGMFTFSSDKDYHQLVNYASSLVAPGGYLITICNTHSISKAEFSRACHDGFAAMLKRRKKELTEKRLKAHRKLLRIQEVKKKVRLRIVDQLNFEPTNEEMSKMYNYTLVNEWGLPKDFGGHLYDAPKGEEYLKVFVWKRNELPERDKSKKKTRSERKKAQAENLSANSVKLLPKISKSTIALKSETKPYM